VDINILRKFEADINRWVPGFKVCFKNESWFMLTLGFLVWPFNPGFMDQYVTTLGKTIWFPNFGYYSKDPEASFTVLAHEYVHLYDSRRFPGWFQVSYMFPQILVALPLLVYAWLAGWHSWLMLVPILGYVLGCAVVQRSMAAFIAIITSALAATIVTSFLLTGWETLVLVGGLALVAPWPAPGRVHWEKRGYAMSIAVRMWLSGRPPSPDSLAYFERQFTGSNYFLMAWRAAPIRNALKGVVVRVSDNGLQDEKPYAQVHEFLYRHVLLAARS